jgi:hypothetical protein
VNRSGTATTAGVETIGGDASDPTFAREVAADADTVTSAATMGRGQALDGRSGAGNRRAGPGGEDALDDRDSGASVPAGPVVGAEAAGVVRVRYGGAAHEQRHGDAG